MRQRSTVHAAARGPIIRLLGTVLLVGMIQSGPWTREVYGATFTVNPTQVFLSPGGGSAVLELRNEGEQPIRFQLAAFAWTQSRTGEVELAPTEDIVFFPALLTLGPFEARRVRIGSVTPFEAREKTYRVFVEELPPLDPARSGVRVLMRMGVPIFLRPDEEVTTARLSVPERDGDRLRFSLGNEGTVHFVPQAIVVRGLAGEEAAFERTLDGWYVLAGGWRDFELTVPEATCRRITAIVVDVRLAFGALQERLPTPNGVCPG